MKIYLAAKAQRRNVNAKHAVFLCALVALRFKLIFLPMLGHAGRISENVEQLLLPVPCLSHIFCNGHKLMEIQVQRVGFMLDIFGDAVNRLLFLLLVGAKQPVPHDECGAIVLIDIFFL